MNRSRRDARKKTAAPFVLVLKDSSIAGYYTLSSTAVQLPEPPMAAVRRLPRYPLISVTLPGRLAVARRYQGGGYGRVLLAEGLYRAVRGEIASFAVIVDAEDESVKRFYERGLFAVSRSADEVVPDDGGYGY